MGLHLQLATELSASDRAALQSLVPLASALGAGTIFGLFFVGRRRASFAVFESIAIVAVLVSVSCTAYYCISLLHRDTAITNKELVETAVPLLVAAVLLILISIVARLRGATQRVMVLLPLVLVAVVAAIEIASSGIVLEPGAAPVVALVILAAAAAFGALGTVADNRVRAATRRSEHDRLALLTGLGYAPSEARLRLAVPHLLGEATTAAGRADPGSEPLGAGAQAPVVAAPPPSGVPAPVPGGLPLDVWRRGEQAFLDGRGAARLRDAVDARWQALSDGEARGAMGETVLLEVEPVGGPRRGDAPTELRLDVLRPGNPTPRRTATVAANGDGLFEITDLLA